GRGFESRREDYPAAPPDPSRHPTRPASIGLGLIDTHPRRSDPLGLVLRRLNIPSMEWRGRPVMRVAAIYDIHGNLPALEAVLQEIRQAEVDHVVVGGDVLPGPMPRETITCLLDLDIPVQFLRGNGDREVLAR